MDAEQIYESMLGELLEPVEGIRNAFAPGEPCAQWYEELYEANCRLCQRLGVEEDSDVECIIDRFFQINRDLCLQMYEYGRKNG